MIDKRPLKEQIEDKLREKLGEEAFEELERLERKKWPTSQTARKDQS
jgi:hypothetical protein